MMSSLSGSTMIGSNRRTACCSTRLQQTAVAAYQALELRDYGRVDMRLQPDGRVHVIEVNPNPWLSSKAEFAMAARKSGRNYPQLVEEIVELAMARA